jgi:polyisoprenoid-binding protein YceI
MKKLIVLLLTTGLSITTQAAWQLENTDSQLNFVSVKANKVGEVSIFQRLEGTINDEGQATLKVDLASVSTNVQTRDERMQKFLFEVEKFSHAELTAQLDMTKIEALKVGEKLVQPLAAELTLHGSTKELESQVVVVRLAEDNLLVISQAPIILNTADFELVDGVKKLAELAKLDAISNAVPVSFVLTFSKQ